MTKTNHNIVTKVDIIKYDFNQITEDVFKFSPKEVHMIQTIDNDEIIDKISQLKLQYIRDYKKLIDNELMNLNCEE